MRGKEKNAEREKEKEKEYEDESESNRMESNGVDCHQCIAIAYDTRLLSQSAWLSVCSLNPSTMKYRQMSVDGGAGLVALLCCAV